MEVKTVIPRVHCGNHQTQPPAAVCVHLAATRNSMEAVRALGFHEVKTDHGIPVGMCASCWQATGQEDAIAGPLIGLFRLVCLRCFHHLRELAGV